MFVRAGSTRIAATSPWARARSSASRSLNSTTRVVSDVSTGAPMLLRRSTVEPSGPSVAKASSTEPW